MSSDDILHRVRTLCAEKTNGGSISSLQPWQRDFLVAQAVEQLEAEEAADRKVTQ